MFLKLDGSLLSQATLINVESTGESGAKTSCTVEGGANMVTNGGIRFHVKFTINNCLDCDFYSRQNITTCFRTFGLFQFIYLFNIYFFKYYFHIVVIN